MSKSIGYDKAFKFSVRIVKLYQYLCKDKKEYALSKQALRSGTAIGACIKDALQAQSRKDYLSKMKIALKEASETEYWLDLLKATDYIDESMYESINSDCTELIKILTATVKTTKSNS
jgi:four helix bundle protein